MNSLDPISNTQKSPGLAHVHQNSLAEGDVDVTLCGWPQLKGWKVRATNCESFVTLFFLLQDSQAKVLEELMVVNWFSRLDLFWVNPGDEKKRRVIFNKTLSSPGKSLRLAQFQVWRGLLHFGAKVEEKNPPNFDRKWGRNDVPFLPPICGCSWWPGAVSMRLWTLDLWTLPENHSQLIGVISFKLWLASDTISNPCPRITGIIILLGCF